MPETAVRRVFAAVVVLVSVVSVGVTHPGPAESLSLPSLPSLPPLPLPQPSPSPSPPPPSQPPPSQPPPSQPPPSQPPPSQPPPSQPPPSQPPPSQPPPSQPPPSQPPPSQPPPSQPPPSQPPPSSGAFLAPQAGAKLIWRDDATANDPLPARSGNPASGYGAWVGGRKDGAHDRFTNSYDQIAPGRLERVPSGGPGGLPYRRITVHPEDVNWSAPRDALGYNWNDASDAGWGIPGPGPTVLWHEGEYHLLTLWMRLGEVNNSSEWRQLFEIKQSEPYTENKPWHGAMFEMQQREGQWHAEMQWDSNYWNAPVSQPLDWVPISVEGFFTADSSRGWMRFKIGDQTSPTIHRQTLLRDDQTGRPVPSFLELGPYQSGALGTASFDYADIRVYG